MELKQIRHLIPPKGFRVLSERTGISYPEIIQMFNGVENIRTARLKAETVKYLYEIEEQPGKAKKAIKQALKSN